MGCRRTPLRLRLQAARTRRCRGRRAVRPSPRRPPQPAAPSPQPAAPPSNPAAVHLNPAAVRQRPAAKLTFPGRLLGCFLPSYRSDLAPHRRAPGSLRAPPRRGPRCASFRGMPRARRGSRPGHRNRASRGRVTHDDVKAFVQGRNSPVVVVAPDTARAGAARGSERRLCAVRPHGPVEPLSRIQRISGPRPAAELGEHSARHASSTWRTSRIWNSCAPALKDKAAGGGRQAPRPLAFIMARPA